MGRAGAPSLGKAQRMNDHSLYVNGRDQDGYGEWTPSAPVAADCELRTAASNKCVNLSNGIVNHCFDPPDSQAKGCHRAFQAFQKVNAHQTPYALFAPGTVNID